MLTAESIKARARALGFDLCGIAPAEEIPGAGHIREWIARGYAGDMGYLPRTAAIRADVRRVLPSARSVIVTGTLYDAGRGDDAGPGEATVSRYARGDDYHEVIGRRLAALLDWMHESDDRPFEARAAVDTGPIHERAYAELAGIGWIGKNGCVINPDVGSWLFLSAIACSLPLPADPPAFDRCGACGLCLESCPTGALVEPRVLDARRCVSYLTIELRRGIPEPLRGRVGSHVYGCDVCQEVCPWNQAARGSDDPVWRPRPGLDRPRLLDLWRRSDGELADLTRGTAMTRATIPGLRRNLAVAIGNWGEPAALRALEESAGTASPSRSDPMVLDHVRWAGIR